VNGTTFVPPTAEIPWSGTTRDVSFQFKVNDEYVALHTVLHSSSVSGAIEIFLGELFIGQVPLSVEIEGERETLVSPHNVEASGKPFKKIFVSYSRQDEEIVDLFIDAYKAIGMEVLKDKETIQSGQNWRRQLERMIDEAEIFQLYWSRASSNSENVEAEWRYALQIKEKKVGDFIKPIYWEKPMPAPPADLQDIHFKEVHPASPARTPGTVARTRSTAPRR
jgi:hypothetical protein